MTQESYRVQGRDKSASFCLMNLLGMNARHVSRGLFRVANTHRTALDRKKASYAKLSWSTRAFQFPERKRRQQRLQVSRRKSRPGSHWSSLSLSLSVSYFFVHSYYSPLPFHPFLPLSSCLPFDLCTSFSSPPCPTNCFRIGESWERSMVTCRLDREVQMRRIPTRRFLSIIELSIPMHATHS